MQLDQETLHESFQSFAVEKYIIKTKNQARKMEWIHAHGYLNYKIKNYIVGNVFRYFLIVSVMNKLFFLWLCVNSA